MTFSERVKQVKNEKNITSAELSVKVKRGMMENALKGKVNGGKPPWVLCR